MTGDIQAQGHLAIANAGMAEKYPWQVEADDFEKTMSENTAYSFMERHGFVICKKDDVIYRQDAIKEIARWTGYLDDDMITRIQIGLRKLPRRKKGRWIKMSDADGYYYACDQCGENLPRYRTESPTSDNPYPPKHSIDKTKFCPNCGADMRGGNGHVNADAAKNGLKVWIIKTVLFVNLDKLGQKLTKLGTKL